MTKAIDQKIDTLPKKPGVYLYKDKTGNIIYIGKAAVLRNRVRQYFQKGHATDTKTDLLVKEINDLDWITVESEVDALFLEAELVRRYLPKYNILLRDDKSSVYVRIDQRSTHPTVSFTRRPIDDGAQYFGPYFNATLLKRALKYLRKIFPYSTHYKNIPKRACLSYHLGLCPGLEDNKTSLEAYRSNLSKLKQYLRGQRTRLVGQIEKEMTAHAKAGRYEQAAQSRNQLFALKGLAKQVVFSDKEFMDISKDQALSALVAIFGLSRPPNRIEGYDISHIQGTDNVASMVVFANGMPDKANYRKFKLNTPGNDDFAHMSEVITRRLSKKNTSAWRLPDLILIDGGKGQLESAIKAARAAGLSVPMIGLAKREEEIIASKTQQSDGNIFFDKRTVEDLSGRVVESDQFYTILLPSNSHVVKLLQRVRDESHRFAVSYHSVLKSKRQTKSWLDDIPSIGPASRKKLLKEFGSMRAIAKAPVAELEQTVGKKRAEILARYLQSRVNNQP